MGETKRILVTGATGKVGRTFIDRFLADPAFDAFTVRALCHNRVLEPRPRLEIMRGSLENREDANEAVRNTTHVLHLATSKETPESVMDVAVKGIFWLLEACRISPTFQQFLLIGGDNSLGHFVYSHPIPVTETQRQNSRVAIGSPPTRK
jgi:nucleoside-diphosphate-sugar epimerase